MSVPSKAIYTAKFSILASGAETADTITLLLRLAGGLQHFVGDVWDHLALADSIAVIDCGILAGIVRQHDVGWIDVITVDDAFVVRQDQSLLEGQPGTAVQPDAVADRDVKHQASRHHDTSFGFDYDVWSGCIR